MTDLLPSRPEQPAPGIVDESHSIRIEMPGKIASQLADHTAELSGTERRAMQHGREVRLGQGYSLLVTALPHVRLALLAAAEVDDGSAAAADRKAFQIYRDRLHNAAT